MNLEAGFQFIIFLILFGFTNYLMMLKRYENDLKKKKLIQKLRKRAQLIKKVRSQPH